MNPATGAQVPVSIEETWYDEVWMNSLYQVNLKRIPKSEQWPFDMIQLSIKRLDKMAVHDWRHLQWIKNELVGEENEGFEMYPAESRLVDTSNQYWMFVFADPRVRIPLGFTERGVWDGDACGSRQRPWPKEKRPADCEHVDSAKLQQMIADRAQK